MLPSSPRQSQAKSLPSLSYQHTNSHKSTYLISSSNSVKKNSNNCIHRKRNGRKTCSVESIEQCRNAFELVQIVRNSSNVYSSIDVGNAILKQTQQLVPSRMTPKDLGLLLNGLSKQRIHFNKGLTLRRNTMSLLADTATSNQMIKHFEAQGISMIVNALAKVRLSNEKLFEMIATKAIAIIGKFNAQGLSNTVNAFSKMRYHHPELFETAAIASIAIIDEFNAQGLTTTVNAFAKMNYSQPALFNSVATACIPIIDTFSAQNLANTVNAFAKLKQFHLNLFNNVASAAIRIIHTFEAQHLSNTVNAFSKVNYTHPKLFDTIAASAISIINTLNAQDLSNTVNAFAKMGHPHPELFSHVATAAIPIIRTFNAQNLANMVNAFAKMNYDHPELFDTIATAAIPIMQTFNPQNLSNIVNAFSKLDHRHPRLFDNVATAAITIINSFVPQGLSNVVNAFAKMNHPHSELFEKVATASIPIIHTFKAQELANTASAFGSLRMTGEGTTNRLFSTIAYEIMHRRAISKLSPRMLVEVGYACLKVDYNDQNLLNTIGNAILSKDEIDLSSQELGNLAACFSRTEVTSSETILRIVCDKFQSMDRDNLCLQSVADVAGAMSMAQHLKVASPTMLSLVAKLAISKINESRPEDVKDILLGLDHLDLSANLWKELLIAYKPFFFQHSQDLREVNRTKICKIYEQSGITIEQLGY